MVQEKLIALIETLAEKSETGALEWEAAASPNSYQTNFPHYTVAICEFKFGKLYELRITNDQGELMETALDSDFPAGTHQRLKTVFSGARRKVMGVDSALDEILSSLQS